MIVSAVVLISSFNSCLSLTYVIFSNVRSAAEEIISQGYPTQRLVSIHELEAHAIVSARVYSLFFE